MSVRRRDNGSLFIDFVTPNGERIRRSAETENRAEAEELEVRLRSEAFRVQKLGERPKRVWQDAVVMYLADTEDQKATHEEDKAKLRWLDRFLAGKELTNINRALIDRIIAAKRAEGARNATINRYLALVRTILRRCWLKYEWIDRAPAVTLFKEPTLRIRFLTQDEAARLLRELPQHLRDMAAFSLATGLRAANVTGLTWEQVKLERRMAFVHPDQAKARRAIPVPLNDAAMDVLRRQEGNHFVKVFTYEGEPVRQVSTKAWYKAMKRAGTENFRWHDLRHTWASWHIQNGTPLHVLQELGGWETPAMVRRYAHLTADHLAAYAGKVNLVIANDNRAPAPGAAASEKHGTYMAHQQGA